MTRAVQETSSKICLSSLGLFVYANWEPFREALNERVRNDPAIKLDVVMQDPTSNEYVLQHKQMLGDIFKYADLFVSDGNRSEEDLFWLAKKYVNQPSLFGVDEILRVIPITQGLYHFAALLKDLNESQSKRVKVKVYSGWFLNCVLMFDHVVYMFPYGVNQDALEAPLFRFLPNQIGFSYFASQFMAVFTKGREIAVTETSTSHSSDLSDGNLQ